MTRLQTPSYLLPRLALSLLLVVPLVALGSAQKANAAPRVTVAGPARPHGPLPAIDFGAVPQASTAGATGAEANAIATVNAYRTRYGAKPIASNSAYITAARQHANYCRINGTSQPGCDRPYSATEWENPTKTGFTSSGSDAANYLLMVNNGGTATTSINVLMRDPGYRDGWLLDLAASAIGVGQSGTWTMVMIDWGGSPAGYPKSWPAGSNLPRTFRGFDLDAAGPSAWTTGCAASSHYGYPISAAWDYTKFAESTKTTGVLYADGKAQPTCMVTNAAVLLKGQAVMMPLGPLANGTIYTGKIGGTFATGSSTTTVSQNISFTTWAPPTWAPGDQSGDRVGDFTAISGSNLYFRKMQSNGVVGASLLISTRFNTSTWIGRAPDVNGDGRDDLMSRNTNGDIYIWYGNGMGSYTQGPKVGIRWNNMNLIAPMGDMTGDGTPEMIARDTSGNLFRYTIYKDKITNRVKLGTGWGGQKWMVGVGRYNNDNRADLISVDKAGNLWEWNTTPQGNFSGKTKLGAGWGGFNYVFSPGDVNRDGRPDLITRDAKGNLTTWFVKPTGFSKVAAGSGWGGYRAFA